MSVISDKCMQQLNEGPLGYTADFAVGYVLLREYLIVHEVETSRLDEAVQKFITQCVTESKMDDPGCVDLRREAIGIGNALVDRAGYGEKFWDQYRVQYMEPWFDSDEGFRLPGFENYTCSLDWHVLACFCNVSATLFKKSFDGNDYLSPFLAAVDAAGFTPDGACPARVMTDPAYEFLEQYTPKSSGGGDLPEPALPDLPGADDPMPDPSTPAPGMEDVAAGETSDGPPWWFWAGAAVVGTWLVWPIAFGKKARR